MIEDIAPHQFHNQFRTQKPGPEDRVMLLRDERLLFNEVRHSYPQVKELGLSEVRLNQAVYLFSLDEEAYFLIEDTGLDYRQGWQPISGLRKLKPNALAMAGITAVQLSRWRSQRQFCGHCGQRLKDSPRERARFCPVCHQMEYPTISPCIITAVIDRQRNQLLVVKGVGMTSRMALIAGYVEIGETLEQAVVREVYEEVGLHIGRPRYYGSQPWAFSGTEMAAFVSELCGSRQLRLQASEIAEAAWLRPDQLPENPDPLSIGHQMIEKFRCGQL